MKVIGVNGILSNGAGSTDLVLSELRVAGYQTHDLALPVRGVLGAYFDGVNRADAERLCAVAQPGDAVVAHSRGALVTYWAMRLGMRFSKIFLFSPAIQSDWPWPCQQAGEIHVIHNPEDRAIALGMLLRLHHPFGGLGRIGYTGPNDRRIRQVEWEGKLRGLLHHGDYFAPEYLDYWTKYIDAALRC